MLLKLPWSGNPNYPTVEDWNGYVIDVDKDGSWAVFRDLDVNIGIGKTSEGILQAQLDAEKFLLGYLKRKVTEFTRLVAEFEGESE